MICETTQINRDPVAVPPAAISESALIGDVFLGGSAGDAELFGMLISARMGHESQSFLVLSRHQQDAQCRYHQRVDRAFRER